MTGLDKIVDPTFATAKTASAINSSNCFPDTGLPIRLCGFSLGICMARVELTNSVRVGFDNGVFVTGACVVYNHKS